MSSWMNNAAVANHAGNGFPHMGDPSGMAGGGMMDPSAFMANPAQFDPNNAGQQYANPQQMAAMQNGQMRNPSPSFSNPVYQTNPVIPSKRPRPREDSIGASPRQNPGMLPASRADTPQQSQFPGFQPNMQPQNPGQPQHYSHLQPNGSTTASPSPVMAGNQLRPGSVPTRVNTASPHPFSPASQQFGQQNSPVPSEHSSTPQPGMYMNNQGFPQGYNPNYGPAPSPARPPSAQNPMTPQMMPQMMGQMPPQMHPQMYNQQMQQMQQQMAMQGRGGMDKMMYQMQMQQRYGQGNVPMAAQMQAQNMAQGRGMMPKQGMPVQNGQMPPNNMRPQQPAQMQRGNPDAFLKQLAGFMSMKQMPLDLQPVVEGRPMNLFQLFQIVTKFSGFRNVCNQNLWQQVASSVGFPPHQIPSASMHLKAVYERNLAKFEEAWAQSQRQHMKQQSTGNAQIPQHQGQGTSQGPRMGQMSPVHHIPSAQPQPQPQPPSTPITTKAMTPGMPQGGMNGVATPQHQMSQQPNAGQGSLRNSVPRSVDATPVSADFPMQSPGPVTKAGGLSVHQPQPVDATRINGTTAQPLPGPLTVDNDIYSPLSRAIVSDTGGTYGGLEIDAIEHLGHELSRARPDMPAPMDLGNIDIHALTRSLQSGIHGEVRLALDVLATVTRFADQFQGLIIDLRHCDDLVESLLDCAEDQVDILVDQAIPNSDEIDLTPYEDVLRVARAEQFHLRKVPTFGDSNYELERAADRLLAVTTILRNLSFPDHNHPVLADEVVIKSLCTLIRTLGTHDNLMVTAQNTLDLMKDLIVLLSNIAAATEIPGREQAFCLLQFVLSFAPSIPNCIKSDKLLITPFDPSTHKYLPHALDALAKLLARDEPNRTHYKAIVAADALASTPYELLTRTFAFAVSPIPKVAHESRPGNQPPLVEARKPLVMQGLLAADIVAQLAPGHESGLTRAWLSSGEGFARNLLKLVNRLCQHAEQPMPRSGGNARAQHREDPDVLYIVTCAISTLRRLTEKARDPNDPSSIPPNVIPSRASLLESLTNLKNPKWAPLLNQLSAYVGLEN